MFFSLSVSFLERPGMYPVVPVFKQRACFRLSPVSVVSKCTGVPSLALLEIKIPPSGAVRKDKLWG